MTIAALMMAPEISGIAVVITGSVMITEIHFRAMERMCAHVTLDRPLEA